MTPKTRVAIVTNVVPSYREGFYDRLLSRRDLDVRIFCQSSLRGVNVRSIHSKYAEHVTLLKTLAANGEAVVWQFIPWTHLLSCFDVVFVGGNPRTLSDAALATLMCVLRKRVVLWTMVHSYRANSSTERVRLMWTRLFKNILVYTDAEVRELRRLGFHRQNIIGMNNGLDQKRIDDVAAKWSPDRLAAWRQQNGLHDTTILLSCARLDPKNKFAQIIEAIPEVTRRVPRVCWCAIGSGPERPLLEALTREKELDRVVRFVGEEYDEERLAPWFLAATLLIHPAAIGLSLFHAFGYGLPVVTHGTTSHHGPEFAAFEERGTGRTFREDDPHDLAQTIVGLIQDEPALAGMQRRALSIARNDYNVDVMVERFAQTIALVVGGGSRGCPEELGGPRGR